MQKITVATSLASFNFDKQIRVVKSWISKSFNVISVNSINEIHILQQIFMDVNFIPAKKNARQSTGKPLIFINEILEYLESGSETVGIVNSDIFIKCNTKIDGFIKKNTKKNLLFGSRVDIESVMNLKGEFYSKGFDFFFFNRSIIKHFPETEFCIGAPWWDYWFIILLFLNDIDFKKVMSPFAFHEIHEKGWTKKQWIYFCYYFCKILNNKNKMFLYNKISDYSFLLNNDENDHMERKNKFCIDVAEFILKFIDMNTEEVSFE